MKRMRIKKIIKFIILKIILIRNKAVDILTVSLKKSIIK
jgi:hypothetical protein